MFAQIDRPMVLTTPLGPDKLLVIALEGREAISEPFHFELHTAWQDTKNPLDFQLIISKF